LEAEIKYTEEWNPEELDGLVGESVENNLKLVSARSFVIEVTGT